MNKRDRRRQNFGSTRLVPWAERKWIIKRSVSGVRMPTDHQVPSPPKRRDGEVDPNWVGRSHEGLPWSGSKRVPLRRRKRAIASFDRQQEHKLQELVGAR